MKKFRIFGLLAILLVVGMMLPGCNLFSGTSGSKKWIRSEEGYRYYILPDTMECAFVDYQESRYPKDVIIPETVLSAAGKTYTVTKIRYSAFFNHQEIESVTLPSTLKDIEEHAFYGCKGLTAIEIPEGVVDIGWEAFRGCSALESVTIPTTLTHIGRNAFQDCKKLKEVRISNVANWCEIRFDMDNERNYTSNPLNGGAHFVLNNQTVENLAVFGNGKREISAGAFYGLDVKTVSMSGVSKIGMCAFCDCANLKTVTVAAETAEIGESAFEKCTALKNVSFTGENPKVIGKSAFEWCASLESIRLPAGLTKIEEYCFAYCASPDSDTEPKTGLKAVEIPESVLAIGKSAFRGCELLQDIYYLGSAEDWSKKVAKQTYDKNHENDWDYNAGSDVAGGYQVHEETAMPTDSTPAS